MGMHGQAEMRKRAAVLLMAVMGVVLTGCGKESASAAGTEKTAEKTAGNGAGGPRQVATVAARAETVADGIAATGALQAFESSKVAAEIEGVVDAIYVEAGQFVKEGAPLVRINPASAGLRLAQAKASEQQAALAVEQARTKVGGGKEAKLLPEVAAAKANWEAAEAELRAAQSEHERTRKLLATGDVSRSEADRVQASWQMAEGRATAARQQYQSALNAGTQDLSGVGVAQAQYEAAKAQRGLLEKQLRDTVVRAPFAGMVSARSVTKGEYVAMGAQVAAIEKVNPLRLMLQVPEGAAKAMRPGMAVQLRGEGGSEMTVCKIATVHPVVSATNRTVTVEAHVENGQGRWKPGMFAAATILDEQERQAILVPASTVVTDPNTDANLVWVVAQGQAKVRTVRLGKRRGENQEILEGLQSGELVIRKPTASLFDGEPVAAAK